MSPKTRRLGNEFTSICILQTFHPPFVIETYTKREFAFKAFPSTTSRSLPPITSLPYLFPRSCFSTCCTVNDSASSFSASTSKPLVSWPVNPNPTPYEIFNLPRQASQKEIKARYFLLVKQYHPDHAPHSTNLDRQTERFRKVVEAYKILSHPPKRAEWDNQNPETGKDRIVRPTWSGSRLSRRKTDLKGPPPSGGWGLGGGRRHLRPDYTYANPSIDNEHFNYERHFRRNLEQELKIKRKMDELHANRMEFERIKEQNKSTARIGLAFTGVVFLVLVMAAKTMTPI